MISLPLGIRILLIVEPHDMRKSFNGLPQLAELHRPGCLAQGALFVFVNRRRNLMKIVYYDRTGICVMAKRLEKGTFSWPATTQDKKVFELAPEALQFLIDGVDLRGPRMRPWYERD